MVGSTVRKKPHCRTCGLPMEGHKRNMRGSPICPSLPGGSDAFDRYASEPPLAQSSPLAKSHIAHGPSQRRTSTTPTPPHPHPVKASEASTPRSALVIPETGPWHWRNPNFVEKPAMPPPPPRPSSPSGSFVPTVLVDSEGRTIRARSKSPSDFNSSGGSGGMRSVGTTSSMLMDRLALMSKPVVSIFNTKYEDIPRIQSTADRLGFHTGVVHRTLDTDARLLDTVEKEEDENDVKVDVAYARAQRRKRLKPQREPSWWLVLGQNKATVQEVIDSQQRGLPGAIASTGEMMEGPRMVTLPYALVIGIIGGLVAACGLYYSLVSIL